MYEDKIETPDNNQKIWRYMDFSKYVDMLTTNTLYFTRADKFEDPYDCSGMQFLIDANKQLPAPSEGKEWTRKVNTFNRLFVYLNCWHMNKDESPALWRLYSENKYETIAIQTTFEKLKSEIENKWSRDGGPSIAKVKYDIENAGKLDENSTYRIFSALGLEDIIYKRLSFEYEKELRAFIYQSCDKSREIPLKNEAHLGKLKERDEFKRIPIDPAKLIEKVYVSPLAKDLFVELVKNVSGELKDRVLKSDLYELY